MPCADSEHINLKFAVGGIFGDKAGRGTAAFRS